jgi:hypothetical protein
MRGRRVRADLGESRKWRAGGKPDDSAVLAREAATMLKIKQPGAEITLRDLEAGTVTLIKHPLDR